MGRGSTINISLTPEQLKLVRQRAVQGGYGSVSEVIRESLRSSLTGTGQNFQSGRKKKLKMSKSKLAEGYRAMRRFDRKTAQDWAQLTDAWPER